MISSTDRKLSTYEVLVESLRDEVGPGALAQELALLSRILQQPSVHTVQFGNSVFVIVEPLPGRGLLSAYNVDSPQNFIANCTKMTQWAKNELGIHSLTFSSSNPAIFHAARIVLQSIGRPASALSFREIKGKKYAVVDLGEGG